jgi:hypothetical protein
VACADHDGYPPAWLVGRHGREETRREALCRSLHYRLLAALRGGIGRDHERDTGRRGTTGVASVTGGLRSRIRPFRARRGSWKERGRDSCSSPESGPIMDQRKGGCGSGSPGVLPPSGYRYLIALVVGLDLADGVRRCIGFCSAKKRRSPPRTDACSRGTRAVRNRPARDGRQALRGSGSHSSGMLSHDWIRS